MKRHLVLYTLLLLIFPRSYPFSSEKLDSLKMGLTSASNNDSMHILLKMAEYCQADSPVLTFEYAKQAKLIANRLDDQSAKAYCEKKMGDAKLDLNDYYESVQHLKNALEFYKTTSDDERLGDLYYSLGLNNYYLGNYAESLSNYLKAISFYQDKKDKNKSGEKKKENLKNLANVYQNIGLLHHAMGNYNLALKYYQQSLEINRELEEKINIAGLVQNIGIISFKEKNYTKALKLYNESLQMYRELGDKEGIGSSLSNIGLINQNLKKYKEALLNYKKSYDVFKDINYKLGIVWALHNIGTSYADLKEYDQAFDFYHRSLDMADKMGHMESILANYEALSNLLTEIGDYKNALYYYKIFKTKNDSIHSAETQEKIAQLESVYQLEQNEAELVKTNAEIARQKTQKQGLILGLTLVLIAAIITYVAYRQKKRAEKQLEEHKKNLEKLVEQKSNELKIEISERKVAEESDKLKSAFLANMSHELRTPMNAIISFSNFLREPKLSYAKRMEYVNYIISSGDSLMHLIDDIIDTAKIESKELRIKKGYTNITRIFSELHHVFSKLKIKNKKEHIDIRVNPSNMKFDYIIRTDPVRFKQILSNLIENALKYTEEGYIEFGFKENSHELTFYVKDTGIGIAKEKHAYIFQRFSQIEYELDRRFGGTGLGLAISKNLVEMLGGKIWLESELHKGSVFYFTLPIEELIKKPVTNTLDVFTENDDIEKNTYNWHGKVIVVAEDEDLNYKVLESMLSKTRVNIFRATNGNEAIELCKTKKANLVLMDIQMPNMDGYSATKEIRKFNPRIPIIAQTSFAMAEEEEKCMAAGCNDYLSKPLNIRDLLEKINKYFYQ